MSVEVTRAYLRGRFMFILAGFMLAVGVGAAILTWQIGRTQESVRRGAVVAAMAESTGNLLYYAMRLQQTGGAGPQSASGTDPRSRHRDALDRLRTAYATFDGSMGADKGGARTGGWLFAPRVEDTVVDVWLGSDEATGGRPLRDDIGNVMTIAGRLDAMSDLSTSSARTTFDQLARLGNSQIRPNLALALDRLNQGAIASFEQIKFTFLAVAILIVAAACLFGALVFLPMMHNVAAAQETLHKANETTEDARRRAEAADRAKSEFLANMSHEIRTPMNGVLGMAELLSKTSLDMRQAMFTDVILKSGNALLTIINDILDFSKIDAGQLELHPAPFRLTDTIEDVAALVSSRVSEKDLELIVRVDPGLPTSVVGDVGRVRQIVTNLVGNAVKFTERGHVLVDVSGMSEGGKARIRLRIEDTGIGIPADKLATVFEKFAQVDASSTRRHEGTGLGLAITSRLVELMGGSIGVDSEVGRGSTFWFEIELPVHEAVEVSKPIPVDVSRARILVVDDNAVNRSILTEQLRSWGFDCAAAESGPVGLAVLRRAAEIGASVDCVILDYQMPDMNGSDVARSIRRSAFHPDVPIVLLTSVDQADVARLLSERTISAYLAKPARSSALLETLVAVLQRSFAVREPPAAPVAAGSPPSSARAPSAGLDILVVEDNEVNQLVIGQILEGVDATWRIAANGRTGVEMHRTLHPRLILMDVSMPEMNGFEATAAIRKAEARTGRHTPIIGLTAHALKGDREKCLASGMDDYLSKPVSPDALGAAVRRWLDGAQAAISA